MRSTGRTGELVGKKAPLLVWTPDSAAELVDARGRRQAHASVAVKLVSLVVLGPVKDLRGRASSDTKGHRKGGEVVCVCVCVGLGTTKKQQRGRDDSPASKITMT